MAGDPRALTASRWRRAVTALGQFAFPRTCAACEAALDDADRGIVCGRCWARVPLLPSPRCERCGHPQRSRGACAGCALLAPFVRAARSLCWVPDDTSSALLAALKYHGWPAVAAGMGERLARLRWPADVEAERVALVPVPLASVKERARGFNQAERLADAVAVHWGIPVWPDALARTRATPSQTRLTPGERLANVHGAFLASASYADRLRGRHVILVDDVLTTGATLNACANALFAAGTRTMSYLTFGRARTAADR
ncbi:MAG: double zinc ribbon domain-containing protein [Gemmatimonadetes bacterium]|nr:double zinc ribbon domain-containing protein [Gemmatimonadota bacterium]